MPAVDEASHLLLQVADAVSPAAQEDAVLVLVHLHFAIEPLPQPVDVGPSSPDDERSLALHPMRKQRNDSSHARKIKRPKAVDEIPQLGWNPRCPRCRERGGSFRSSARVTSPCAGERGKRVWSHR